MYGQSSPGQPGRQNAARLVTQSDVSATAPPLTTLGRRSHEPFCDPLLRLRHARACHDRRCSGRSARTRYVRDPRRTPAASQAPRRGGFARPERRHRAGGRHRPWRNRGSRHPAGAAASLAPLGDHGRRLPRWNRRRRLRMACAHRNGPCREGRGDRIDLRGEVKRDDEQSRFFAQIQNSGPRDVTIIDMRFPAHPTRPATKSVR